MVLQELCALLVLSQLLHLFLKLVSCIPDQPLTFYGAKDNLELLILLPLLPVCWDYRQVLSCSIDAGDKTQGPRLCC